ncbi:Uu.00g106640.m01.CDS01 [Anthostomella pinea]|uniref:Uu.00g106640.m01.CDS01 n=1 Tax=Anthostomella pinea TaxID=933095 RepID=A0AAI8YG18_9PEZI|nr:Uu.00g106640.m01.CDS01 [Anthostomella pinea]
MEPLTHNDMKDFVTSKFYAEPAFVELRMAEQDFADQLIESIVEKAAGVFLWVHIVVTSLIAGMESGDKISDLKARLDLLPPDLSLLYEKILTSLDPSYLGHAAQLFRLVDSSPEPINLLLVSFVDEDAPSFALQRSLRHIEDSEIKYRMDTMRRRINSRTRGLLEVQANIRFDQALHIPKTKSKAAQCSICIEPSRITSREKIPGRSCAPRLCPGLTPI